MINLDRYIKERYPEFNNTLISMTNRKIIRNSYGFAVYDAVKNLEKTIDEVEKEINPTLLKTSKSLIKIINKIGLS